MCQNISTPWVIAKWERHGSSWNQIWRWVTTPVAFRSPHNSKWMFIPLNLISISIGFDPSPIHDFPWCIMLCIPRKNPTESGWYTYPSEKYESQLGWWHSQYMEQKNVPNHQPAMISHWILVPITSSHRSAQLCAGNSQAFNSANCRLCGWADCSILKQM